MICRSVAVAVLISLLVGVVSALPQGSSSADTTLRLLGDTVAASPTSHSPALAMTLSALCPGLGQGYNRSYWKIPVIAGLGGYFVYGIIRNHRDYTRYQEEYESSLLALPPAGNSRLRDLRDFYRGQRDSFGWYFLILYLLNIADAYVDASLFSFDVGDDLAVRDGAVFPVGPGMSARLNLRFHF